jgi:geranylgeranyl diphosphate synthase type II
MNFEKYLTDKKNIIDKALDNFLPPEDKKPSVIHKAMRYSVFSGGKRIRPILTLAAAELLGKNIEKVLNAACGIELIHSFSLIHDDLPCMDDDDFRRGKPSSHKVFGEAIAILAGDALLVSGFEMIIKSFEIKGIKKRSVLKLLKEIPFYIGTNNLLGGQVEDITEKKEQIKKEELYDMYMKKTSALICFSLRAGAILSDANCKQLEALTNYGNNLGLAFQITDDILDMMQDQREVEKPTYLNKYGIKESELEAEKLIQEAKDSLKIFDENKEVLDNLADYILLRKKEKKHKSGRRLVYRR